MQHFIEEQKCWQSADEYLLYCLQHTVTNVVCVGKDKSRYIDR